MFAATLLLLLILFSSLSAPPALAGWPAFERDAFQAWKEGVAQYRTSAYLQSRRSTGATGTGIVLDERLHVLTSYHVVKGCEGLMLRHGNRVLRARPGPYDEVLDLAILVPEKSFPATPATFRTMPPVAGEQVVIAGFPKEVVNQGLLKAVSAKIVDVNVKRPSRGMMRLSAGLNQGASGGPVLDLSGRVVGIVTGILRNSRNGKPVEAPGVALRGEIVQGFLRRAGIDFRQGTGRAANIASIAKQAASQVVKIECSGRRH